MDDKKKKYTIPEAEVMEFNSDDIIVTSLTTEDEYSGWGDTETTDTL